MKTAEAFSLEIKKAAMECLQSEADPRSRIRALDKILTEWPEKIQRAGVFHPWLEAVDALAAGKEEQILLCALWCQELPGGTLLEEGTLQALFRELNLAALPSWVWQGDGRARLSVILSAWLAEEMPELPKGARLMLPTEEKAYGLEELLAEGEKAFRYAAEAEESVALCMIGPQGSGREFYFRRLCASKKLAALLIDAAGFADTERNLEACMLCARLYGAVACVQLDSENRERLLQKMSACFHFYGVIREEGRDLAEDAKATVLRQWMPMPGRESRLAMAEGMLGEWRERLPSGLSMEQIAGRQLPTGRYLRYLRSLRAELSCKSLRPESLFPPPAFAALCPLPANRSFEELKLPAPQYEKLRQIGRMIAVREEVLSQWGFAEKFSYGNGLCVLFYGAPGTGKTMAAQALAHELSMPLYRVDLAQMISKYIGETQKNIGRVFDEAGRQECILLFDEADAVFARRSDVSDAQDRYSNAETAYLLQRIEQYTGICVLATNLLQNFDEAFRRRIFCMVHFPMPDAALRQELWAGIFPDGATVSPEVDFCLLARNFELSGASIRSAAWHGALAARAEGSPVTMSHLLDGIQNEYQKQGRAFPGGIYP